MSDVKSVAGITPLKTLMPAVFAYGHEKTTDQVIQYTKLITELHDLIQLNIPGSRERALVLTKLEEAQHWLAATQAS